MVERDVGFDVSVVIGAFRTAGALHSSSKLIVAEQDIRLDVSMVIERSESLKRYTASKN